VIWLCRPCHRTEHPYIRLNTVLVAFRLPPELAERIVDYRFKHRFASETAAIRLLLEKALDAAEREEKAERKR
jgi:Arc/MetJ-type ribon-helix-helix transcriptional regulator